MKSPTDRPPSPSSKKPPAPAPAGATGKAEDEAEDETEDPSRGQVVELSRFRADLGRGRRQRRADVLLESPRPREAIRALPGDEFYYVIHELGFPEATAILQHGTPEQVQTALDFALWDRDQIAPDRVDEWLSEMIDAPPATLSAWMKGLDVELFALMLRQRAVIHNLTETEGELPDHVEGPVWNTPDRFFAVELLGDDDAQRVTRALCDLLYRMDAQWMRRILVAVSSELDAELEEQAYRWKSGRLADLGFEEYYQALEVYREIDPASVKVTGAGPVRQRPLGDARQAAFSGVPTGLAERLSGGSPFARAVAGITDKDELANVEAALVILSNRVLAADRVTPGDDEAVAASLTRLAATLDLAIEFLARQDVDEAVRAVRSVPLVRLFQVGVSLTGKIRKVAHALLRKTPFAVHQPPVDLFEPEDGEVLRACSRLRPLFPRALEQPPAPGERPFASLVDVALATAALERAGAALALVLALGAKPGDPGLDALDTASLGRALLARRWLGAPADLRPLSPAHGKELVRRLKDVEANPSRRTAAAAELRSLAPSVGGAVSAAVEAVLTRWIDGLLRGLPFPGAPS
ncbi:MAG TPA: DUF6178 family protein [Polyangia bacterium]